MDDVEKQEKQSLDEYVKALERTTENLDKILEKVTYEKERLFEDYVDSLRKLHNIGG
jgi:hypothetical protein